jgi:nucleoside-diphosphate-sugar epimerase
LGTYNLLKVAVKNKVKSFLFFSSGEIYGNSNKKLKEDKIYPSNNLDLRASYSESKKMGETLCYSYFKQKKIPIKIIRLFHTYGPGMDLDDGRFMMDFVRDALQGDAISLASAGTAMRCFCYLTDATSGFLHLLSSGVAGEAYNLANPSAEITILELAHLISRLSRSNPKVQFVDPKHAKPDYMVSPAPRSFPSTTKINELGWQPKIGLEEGFRRTLLSYSFLDNGSAQEAK